MRERQYRLFGKVGVLDIIIVVLIIAFLVSIFSYAANMDVSAAAGGQQDIEFGVYLSNKDADFEDNLVIGMNIYDSLKGGKIGTLASYEKEPYFTLQPNRTTGEIVKSEVDGRYNYIVVVSSSAEITENTVAVGNYEVAVGKEMFIKSKNFASPGFCITLDIGGEDNE